MDAIARLGLDMSVDSCAWSSYPPEKQGTLSVRGFALSWVASMTFVGTAINFSCNDGEAILHRLTQAAKSLGAWRLFLRSPRVAVKKRLKLLISTVFASALLYQTKRTRPVAVAEDSLSVVVAASTGAIPL